MLVTNVVEILENDQLTRGTQCNLLIQEATSTYAGKSCLLLAGLCLFAFQTYLCDAWGQDEKQQSVLRFLVKLDQWSWRGSLLVTMDFHNMLFQ